MGLLVFERIIYKQITSFMKLKFSTYLCHFTRRSKMQHSLLKTSKIWKKSPNKVDHVVVILIDLSKYFGAMNHSLVWLG